MWWASALDDPPPPPRAPHAQAMHAVNCRFAGEDTIWKHYEEISRGFYVHKLPDH